MNICKIKVVKIMSNGCVTFSYEHVSFTKQIFFNEKDRKKCFFSQKNKKDNPIEKGYLSGYTNKYFVLK
jgi:hypothetical protein